MFFFTCFVIFCYIYIMLCYILLYLHYVLLYFVIFTLCFCYILLYLFYVCYIFCYGFKKYTRLFNYNFDTIVNPVERLLELVTMLNKFSKLSSEALRDLYELELETIEYNYNHYFSQDYLTCLEKFR